MAYAGEPDAMSGVENAGVYAQRGSNGFQFADVLRGRTVKPAVTGFAAGVNDGEQCPVQFLAEPAEDAKIAADVLLTIRQASRPE